jgi:hypothetical protein
MTFAAFKFIWQHFTKDSGAMRSIYRSDIDRRSATNRRQVHDLDYFQSGGIERRTGKERRSKAEVREMSRFEMPLYQVKFHEKDDWVEISELKFMDQLYRSFNKVTPAIKEMIMGKEVKTKHGIYRLRLKGNHQS